MTFTIELLYITSTSVFQTGFCTGLTQHGIPAQQKALTVGKANQQTLKLAHNDFQELINHSHDMAEKLLIKQKGEFYPFGALIDEQGILTNVGHYNGNEFPLSQTKIDELRKYFENEVNYNKIRAFAITFDCLAKKDSNSEKSDAIAIECYSKENEQKTIYYFPYRRLPNDELEFGEAWGEAIA